jgi:LPS-assembly lipoprotein
MNRVINLTALALAALALGACGFTPLYAINGVSPGLSAIQVHVSQGRTAFLLGEDLDDAFARNRDAPPVYRLDISITERSYARGLSIANTAKYFEGQYSVHYKLTEIATNRLLKTGAQSVQLSYAAASQPDAGIAAGEDAKARAASEAARKICLDIAEYFASKTTH